MSFVLPATVQWDKLINVLIYISQFLLFSLPKDQVLLKAQWFLSQILVKKFCLFRCASSVQKRSEILHSNKNMYVVHIGYYMY